MDIREIKNLFENKIKADKITREVKKQIKETIWEKQNQREGFTESFKPLIGQFEDPGQDKDGEDKAKNIFTQNRDMIKNQAALTAKLAENQLALTEGLEANRKAITDGNEQLERYFNFGELPQYEPLPEPEPRAEAEPRPKARDAPDPSISPIVDIDKIFTPAELTRINDMNYSPPSFYIGKSRDRIDKDIADLKSDIQKLNGRITSKEKKAKKTKLDRIDIDKYKSDRILMGNLIKSLKEVLIFNTKYLSKTGQGLNTNEIIDRLKLLGGSIMAGNDGVIPEFTQLSNYLNAMGILSNKELQKLMSMIKVTTS